MVTEDNIYKNISVGIISYNDVSNICNLVKYFLEYQSDAFKIVEVVVIATREFESVVEILERLTQETDKFSYILQTRRKGKISAINTFLESPRSPIVILCSGDVYPEKDALDFLINPFLDSSIGMTGGRVVPVQPVKSAVARLDMILWKLHHLMASQRPKLGEMVAFRNCVKYIPKNITVDEAYIEHVVTLNGQALSYQPAAVTYNYTYTHAKDFLRKRIRINLGHKYLERHYGYKVSSQRFRHVYTAVFKAFLQMTVSDKMWLIVLLLVEAYSRGAASMLFILRHHCPVWPLPESKVGVNLLLVLDYAARK